MPIDKLEISFIKEKRVYCLDRDVKPWGGPSAALVIARFFQIPLSDDNMTGEATKELGLDDEIVIANSQNFVRWRVASESIWGTERTLDDRETRIFHLPIKEINELKEGKSKLLSRSKLTSDERIQFLCQFYTNNGYELVQAEARRYWESIDGRGISASAIFPGQEGWPTGSKGIYFDFMPNSEKEQKSLTLFILFEEKLIAPEKKERWLATQKCLIEAWKCNESTVKRAEGKEEIDIGNGRRIWEPRGMLVKGECIATSMAEPFYVLERKDDYYFTTISGKIYIAPRMKMDAKKVEALIADLDSDVFATREIATGELRALGKPVQPGLEARLLKSPISEEQKRRITQILTDVRRRPDRETELLWQDEKRPVAKLLFDQDKDKVYAFTKPDHDKRVWYFEVAAKPEPKLFTGKAEPDTPAGVPASVRTFVEYARFVRKEK
jgi:hypothetical protein